MIYAYGTTEIGPYHAKNDTVCQDAHYIKKISDDCAVAAVADGLGSEDHSDIASKIASQTAVEFCADHFSPDMEDDAVLQLIMQSFRIAQCKIEDTARESGHEITQYDTTLDLVIYCSGSVYYGHAGDSGIVIQTDDGMFGPLTEQDRDDYGFVFPLIFEDHWKFGKAEKPVASVMLCTDGMLGLFFPVLLRNEPVSTYVALAQFFMDRDRLGFEEKGETAVSDAMTSFIAGLEESQVEDDKTVVVLCNSAIKVNPQADEYYAVPDFVALEKAHREKFMREAYPHLAANAEGGADQPDLSADDPRKTGDGEAEGVSIQDGAVISTTTAPVKEAPYAKKLGEMSLGAKQLDPLQPKVKRSLGDKLKQKLRNRETL